MLCNVTAEILYCDTALFCFGCKDKVKEEGRHTMLHECATKNLKNVKYVETSTALLNASIQKLYKTE
jgi:hypothetical protein